MLYNLLSSRRLLPCYTSTNYLFVKGRQCQAGSSSDSIWASVGSTLGKLTGNANIVGDGYIIWGCLLATMVLVNTWGCRHYLRSLDAASNSVAPTVISAASSYVLSGIIGIFLFGESSSIRWWIGAILIVVGLALTAQPRIKHRKNEKIM